MTLGCLQLPLQWTLTKTRSQKWEIRREKCEISKWEIRREKYEGGKFEERNLKI